MLKVKFISPMEKIFRDTEPKQTEFCTRAYAGEPLCFQVCVTTTVTGRLYVETDSDAAEFLEIEEVKYVPSLVADYEDPDDYRIFTERTSTYYPDLLQTAGRALKVVRGYWSTLFVTVKAGLPAGGHYIKFRMGDYEYRDVLVEETFCFSVSEAALVPCDIPVSCWIYYDSIAKAHEKTLFSARYYKILKNYFRHATKNGINTVFVPLFSHPQRDVRGKTPEIVQLLGVREENGAFGYDFSRLEKFLDTAIHCGYTYFEFSHVASQQGADHCPKIVGEKNGEMCALFDCGVPATDERYLRFLRGAFSGVYRILQKKGIADRAFFHISDEPQKTSAEKYMKIGKFMREILPEANLIDAVSDACFANADFLTYPVAATNRAKAFENRDFWAYYCCDQSGGYLSNRFFNFPLLRTRVIGVQLYLNGAKGFLHWAYNYWLNLSTLEYIDPVLCSDGGGIMPSGDCYLIYPDKTACGAFSSLREKAFADGLRDYRALKTLETAKGRAYVLKILKKFGFDGFSQYPHDEKTFLRFSDMLLREIERESIR